MSKIREMVIMIFTYHEKIRIQSMFDKMDKKTDDSGAQRNRSNYDPRVGTIFPGTSFPLIVKPFPIGVGAPKSAGKQ